MLLFALLIAPKPYTKPTQKDAKEADALAKWPLTPPFKSACLLPQPPIHTPHALPLPCNIPTATFLGHFTSFLCGWCLGPGFLPTPAKVSHQILPSTQVSRHILLGLH